MAVVTIADEIRAAHDKIKSLVHAAQVGDRDLTPEEDLQVKSLVAKMEALQAKRQRHDKHADLLGTINGSIAELALSRRPLFAGGGEKSPGQTFIESDEYRAMIDGGLTRGPRPPLVVEVPLPGGLEMRNATPWLSPPGGYPAQTMLPPVAPGQPVLLPRTAQLFGRRPAPEGGQTPYLVDASTGAAAPTAENTAKPEIVLTLQLKNAPQEMIACYAKLSEQVLEDVSGVQSWIDSYLSNLVLFALDGQLVAGTGISPQLIGLVPLAGKTADHAKGATESIPDAILSQILAVSTNSKGLPVTGVILAPDVYASISTAKASTSGIYLSGMPITDSPPTLLWGRAMSVNPALAPATALVGSFLYGATLAIKGGMRIAMTNSDQDDFIKNLVSVRAEIRCALTPSVPAAFGLVTGLLGT